MCVLLYRRFWEKKTDTQRIYHGQTSPGRSMDPCGRGKVQRIRGKMARPPLHRIQRFEISLETKLSRTARQPNPFQGRLDQMAIRVLVAVASLLSDGALDAMRDTGEACRVGEAIPERIECRRTDHFGRIAVLNFTLHMNVVARIRLAVTLM